jgi:DNA-directed RNA polymerase specialized sigma24 family protein
MLGTNGFPLHEGPADETHGPEKLSEWVDFHEAIEQLDEPLRIVFQMSWYQMMSHEEMALALKCSTKTIQRRFREACLQIKRICESIPGER